MKHIIECKHTTVKAAGHRFLSEIMQMSVIGQSPDMLNK